MYVYLGSLRLPTVEDMFVRYIRYGQLSVVSHRASLAFGDYCVRRITRARMLPIAWPPYVFRYKLTVAIRVAPDHRRLICAFLVVRGQNQGQGQMKMQGQNQGQEKMQR